MDVGDIVFVPSVLLEGLIIETYQKFYDFWKAFPEQASKMASSGMIDREVLDNDAWHLVAFFPYVLVDGDVKIEITCTTAYYSSTEMIYQDSVSISNLDV